jgi:hypothetical protein
MKGSEELERGGSGRLRSGSPTLKVVGLITGVVTVAVVVAGYGAASRWWSSRHVPAQAAAQSVGPASWNRTPVDAGGLVQADGVKVTHVAITGDGGLVDLRFQVIDPSLAAAIHDPTDPPAVVDEQSGVVVHDLFMGHSHNAPFHAGVSYYLIFLNPGNLLQRGSQVSVLLGNVQIQHVIVQ